MYAVNLADVTFQTYINLDLKLIISHDIITVFPNVKSMNILVVLQYFYPKNKTRFTYM